MNLAKALDAIDGFERGESIFSPADAPEPAWWCNGTQVAQLAGDRAVDVRLTRTVIRDHRSRLREDERVELRRSGSDWVVVMVHARADVDFLRELCALAAAAHAPAPGVPPRPVPTGADLAKRRRWH